MRNHFSKEEAKKRMTSQMSTEAKKPYADKLLDNSGDLTELKAQINQLLQEL